MTPDRVRPTVFYSVVTPVMFAALVTGVVVGSTYLEWSVVLRVLASKLLLGGWIDLPPVTRPEEAIVWVIRLPRVLVAGIVGAGLATAAR